MINYKSDDLIDMTSHQLLSIIQEARGMSSEMGTKWVEFNKHYKDKKETLSHKLKAMTIKIMDFEGIKLNEAKIRAEGSEEYRKLIEEMNLAEYDANIAEIEYKSWIKSLDAIGSVCYVRNNELKLVRQ